MRDTFVSWKKILAEGFTSPNDLLKFLELPVELASEAANNQFKTWVPYSFAERMQKRNPQDPLLLQVLATEQEMYKSEYYIADPLAEMASNPLPGLIRKYEGRVLLTFTGICAINCRYCFRRHFSYKENNPGRLGWQNIIDYLKADSSIYEVIFSGGDPLLASDKTLADFIEQLETIRHIKIIRFHTRIPIVLPERIDEGFLSVLSNTSLRKVMVLHCNHPQEINEHVKQVCSALQQVGCTLLNQAVLLKKINNNVDVLFKLSEVLFDCGVLPYYLHILDKVSGAAHFDLDLVEAKNLYAQLQAKLPGYLLPRLATEEAGRPSKTLMV